MNAHNLSRQQKECSILMLEYSIIFSYDCDFQMKIVTTRFQILNFHPSRKDQTIQTNNQRKIKRNNSIIE